MGVYQSNVKLENVEINQQTHFKIATTTASGQNTLFAVLCNSATRDSRPGEHCSLSLAQWPTGTLRQVPSGLMAEMADGPLPGTVFCKTNFLFSLKTSMFLYHACIFITGWHRLLQRHTAQRVTRTVG